MEPYECHWAGQSISIVLLTLGRILFVQTGLGFNPKNDLGFGLSSGIRP